MSGQNKTVCDYNEFRRPRYFHGMLLEDRDFKDEQAYHGAKRRFLNRMLHGSGVVCGLELSAKEGTKELEISSGLALDCCGNEIWVDNDLRLDLGKLLKADSARDRDCPPDETGQDKNERYVVLEYREIAVDPVSVYLPGGGCDQQTCEHSRTREGYCVRLVKNCPHELSDNGLLQRLCECSDEESNEEETESARGCLNCDDLTEPAQKCRCRHLAEFCEQSVPCPDCGRGGEYDAIVLGRIELDDKCERIQRVCQNDCRRYVLTGRLIQHLIVSVLAGAGKHLSVQGTSERLPDAATIAQNPIYALCWYLRHFVVAPGEWKVEDCAMLEGGAAASATNEAVERRIREAVEQERRETTRRIETLQKTFDDRVKAIEQRLA
jgi:hypothetical protein